MHGSTRIWWLLLCAIALAAYGVIHLRSPRPAPLTPGGGPVDALRTSVKGANVIIVVMDATRADHVGYHGYPRETTPNLNALSKQSVAFERHFSQSAETKSSTACLLTSQYCDTNLADGPRPLLPGTFTMEAGLQKAGLHTLLISSNIKASPFYGLGVDFQDANFDPQLGVLATQGEKQYLPTVALRAFSNWLEDHSNDRFFAYLHLARPTIPTSSLPGSPGSSPASGRSASSLEAYHTLRPSLRRSQPRPRSPSGSTSMTPTSATATGRSAS